jgi:thiamine pyrophosphate-dependent acetolactate synthase large subunit-like protein
LILGSRLTQLSTAGWSMKFKGFTMHNNIDGEDIGKIIIPHQPIVADTNLFLRELLTLLKQKNISRDIDIEKEIRINKKLPSLKPHNNLWPYDVVRLLQQFTYDRIFVDLSAVTFDSIRMPIERPIWFTSESLLEKGIGIAGIIESKTNSLGIIDISTAEKNLSLLHYKSREAKGTIVIFNDEASSYLDTTKSDMPTIGRTNYVIDIDRELESIGAITVDTYMDLKDALKNRNSERLNIINVKIDPNYESVVLFRTS